MTTLSLAVLGVALYPLAGLMSWEERGALSWLFEWRGTLPPAPQVAVVAIDDDTAAALGLPEDVATWPRSVHGRLVQRLTQLGARVIAFDVFFENPSSATEDQALADAIKDSGRVILFAHSQRKVLDQGDTSLYVDQLQEPLPLLQHSALTTAPFMLPKWPARVSRFWAFNEGLGQRPTLPTAAALAWWHEQGIERSIGPPAERIFNFFGPSRSLAVVPFQDVIQGRPLAFDLRGRAVFVGYVSRHQPAQRDGFYTVFSRSDGVDLTGVELAATACVNLLDNADLKAPPAMVWLLIVALYGVLVSLLARLPWSGLAVLAPLLLALLYTTVVYELFRHWYLWLPLLVPLFVQTPLALIWHGYLRGRVLRAQRDRIRAAFGLYLPENEVKRLAGGSIAGQVPKRLSGVCLATDAENYTRLSEHLEPEVLAEVMSRYYEAVFAPIRQHGGIISDVAGDGVIALWPAAKLNQALFVRVCAAARAIQKSVDQLNAKHPEVALPTRIGVHAGNIVLGHLGALDHFEYRAVGDIVNTACRIEGLNKQLGTRVLVSGTCMPQSLLPHARVLGNFLLSGKAEPVDLYEIDADSDLPAHLRERFHQGLQLLQQGQLQAASKRFESILETAKADGPAEFYRQQCSAALAGGDNLTSTGVVRILMK